MGSAPQPTSQMLGYTRHTLRAVVDALVPRTPELASSHGPEYVAGGVDVGLEEYLVEAFNGYQEHHHGRVSRLLKRFGVQNYPYATLVAILLDLMAVELLLRRDNEDPVPVATAKGPFARLSAKDRLRAIDLLETGTLGQLAERYEETLPHLGTVRFLALGINTFPLLGYYSEWGMQPDGSVPGWEQTGYPGPRDGFAAHRGYEIEEFE